MTPEEFDRLFDNAFTEWAKDPAQSLLVAYFPPSVIERLRASSVPAPALFFEYLKRLESDRATEQSFTEDLFRLLGDEDGFEWPPDDLGRCLALAVFREHARECVAGDDHELKMLDDTDSGGDEVVKEEVGISVRLTRSLFGDDILRRSLLRVSLAKPTFAALPFLWLRKMKPQFGSRRHP
jgi:hypothetical protein